jgi:molecular chaperone GrpE
MSKETNEKKETPVPETPAKSPVNEEAAAAAAESEKDALQNEILYLRAEFDNYKKRILREQDQSIKFGNEKLIRELLGIVDLLERGLSHGKELVAKATSQHLEEVKLFLSGIEMTGKELSQLLVRFGVEFIGTVGEKFDPSKHDAISQVEAEPDQVGTVIQVAQKGCSLHGRLLIPAKVVVGKPKG